MITVPMPDLEARKQITVIHLRGKPTSVDPSVIAEKTEGFSGAEIEGLIENATKRATRRYLEAHPKEDRLEELTITKRTSRPSSRRPGNRPAYPSQ